MLFHVLLINVLVMVVVVSSFASVSNNLRIRKIPTKPNPTITPSDEYNAMNEVSNIPTFLPTVGVVVDEPKPVTFVPSMSPLDSLTSSLETEEPTINEVEWTESPSFLETKANSQPPMPIQSNPMKPILLPKVPPKLPSHQQSESVVTFLAFDAKPLDHFGHTITSDGTNIFIGTYTWGKPNTIYVESFNSSSIPMQWFENSKVPLPGLIPLNEFNAGLAVAANDSFIVGSPYDSTIIRNAGSVTVYKRYGRVGYKPLQTIVSKIALALFGFSVSTHNDLLAISAPGEKSKASGYSGRVYIYRFNTALKKFVEITKLAPIFDDLNRIGNGFGSLLSLSNNVLGVSVQTDKTYGAATGTVFLYDIVRDDLDSNSAPSLTFVEHVLDPPEQGRSSFSNFGRTLLVSDDHAFISANLADGSGSGCVYVYTSKSTWIPVDDEQRVEDVNWILVTVLQSPVSLFDTFGYSLAIYNDKLLAVGSPTPQNTISNPSSTGYVFLYRASSTGIGNDETWKLVLQLESPNRQPYSNFGVSLTTFGDSLVVADDTANGFVNQSGAVYLFKKLYSIHENEEPDQIPSNVMPTDDSNPSSDNIFRAARQNLPFILGFMLPTIIIGSILIGRHLVRYARRPQESADNTPVGSSSGDSSRHTRKRGKKMTKLGLISAALSPIPPFSETLHSSPNPTVLHETCVIPYSQAEEENESEAKVGLEHEVQVTPNSMTESIWSNFYGSSRHYSHQKLPMDEERSRSPGPLLQIDTLTGSERHPILQSPIPQQVRHGVKWHTSFKTAWRAVTKKPATEEDDQSALHLQEQGTESLRV